MLKRTLEAVTNGAHKVNEKKNKQTENTCGKSQCKKVGIYGVFFATKSKTIGCSMSMSTSSMVQRVCFVYKYFYISDLNSLTFFINAAYLHHA